MGTNSTGPFKASSKVTVLQKQRRSTFQVLEEGVTEVPTATVCYKMCACLFKATMGLLLVSE